MQEAGSTALSVNKGMGEGTFSDSKHTVYDYAKHGLSPSTRKRPGRTIKLTVQNYAKLDLDRHLQRGCNRKLSNEQLNPTIIFLLTLDFRLVTLLASHDNAIQNLIRHPQGEIRWATSLRPITMQRPISIPIC